MRAPWDDTQQSQDERELKGPAKTPEVVVEVPRKAADAEAKEESMRDYDKRRTEETTRKVKPPAPKIMDVHRPDIPLRDYFHIRDKQDRDRQERRRAR